MSGRRLLALGLVLGAGWLAGCSGGGDDGVSPPPPTDYVDAEPNDFTAQSIGALDSTDITVGGTTSDADVDLYRINLTAATALFVQLDWSGGQDLEFAVSDDQGVFVTLVDTGANPETCTLPGLGPGDRLIRVDSRSSSPASYVLTIGPR